MKFEILQTIIERTVVYAKSKEADTVTFKQRGEK